MSYSVFTRQMISWLGASVLLYSTLASGGEPSVQDAAVARSLFAQGRKLAEEKKYAEACPKFEESQRLDPGVGTQFNLADCYEGMGRNASAWVLFLEVARQAKLAGQAERENAARKRANAVESKVARVILKVPQEAQLPGLEVRRDGAAVGEAVFNVAVPLDGGTHTLEATAPGHRKWTSTFEVPAEPRLLEVMIPRLTLLKVDQPATLPLQTTPIQPAVSPPPAVSRTGSTQRTMGLIAGGIGVAGLGVGILYGVKSGSTHDDANLYCSGDVCGDPRGVELHDQAKTSQRMAWILGGTGAAALAGGVALYFTASRSPAGVKNASLQVGPGSLVVRGVF